MQRLRFLTIAFVGIATLSLTNAAYSAQSSLTKKGVIAPPQKTLNKKNDEIAKRGIIIVSGKNKPGSDRMLNPQPLPPKAINTLGSSDRMMNSPSQKALGGQKSY
jgi:hypothetical protein